MSSAQTSQERVGVATVRGPHVPTLGFSLVRAGPRVGLGDPGCVWLTGEEPSLWLQVDQATKASTVLTAYHVSGPGGSSPVILATTLHEARFQSAFY